MSLQKFVLVPFAKFIKNHQTAENGGELTAPLVHLKATPPPRTLKPTFNDCGSSVYVDSVKSDGLPRSGLDDITQTPRPIDRIEVGAVTPNTVDTMSEDVPISDTTGNKDNTPVNIPTEKPPATDNVSTTIPKDTTSQKTIKSKKTADRALNELPGTSESLGTEPPTRDVNENNKKVPNDHLPGHHGDLTGDLATSLERDQSKERLANDQGTESSIDTELPPHPPTERQSRKRKKPIRYSEDIYWMDW